MCLKVVLLAVLILYSLQQTYCWKPISNSAAYSLHQTFPDYTKESVSRSAHNIIHHSSDASGSVLNSFKNSEHIGDSSCAVEKFAFDHEATVAYGTDMVKLDQFTICAWARFTKHDGDHVIFTYSVHDEPREIQFYVANSNSSSFITLAVRGHSLYRLNYPLGLKKWHHTCTSWNGKTGEWQLWVSSERVGRGFYNRLVSHEIEAGGKAFSGGKSVNGPTADGLHFELTLLQLYSVALSAGKAHRNHKHHHVHKFDHNGEIEPTTTTPAPPAVNQPVNPLLANGQIPTRVKINLAGVQPQVPEAPSVNTNFVRGQFHTGERNVQQQLINGNFERQALTQRRPSAKFSSGIASAPTETRNTFTSTYTGFGSNPANVRIFDDSSLRLKRQLFGQDKLSENQLLVGISDGSGFDSQLFDSDWYDGLAQFGDSSFKQTLTQNKKSVEDEVKDHDREPAEGEVEAVRTFCNLCLIEPFQSALVIPWKAAIAEKDVLKAKASTICGDF